MNFDVIESAIKELDSVPVSFSVTMALSGSQLNELSGSDEYKSGAVYTVTNDGKAVTITEAA